MFTQPKIFRIMLFALITTGLMACNVDDPETTATKSTEDPVLPDLVPPKVLSTVPASAATGVSLDTDIVVKFDKNIAAVADGNIQIFPMSVAMIIEAPIVFTSSIAAETLTIVPEAGALQALTMYQVRISGVKSSNAIAMKMTCTWQFETLDSGAVAVLAQDKPALCATSTIVGSPDAPQNVVATAIDDVTVEINWQAPASGSAVTYYQIEKSTDNNQTFTLLDGNVTGMTYTDANAEKGVVHVYKITAGNDVALSTVFTLSNEVTPNHQKN